MPGIKSFNEIVVLELLPLDIVEVLLSLPQLSKIAIFIVSNDS